MKMQLQLDIYKGSPREMTSIKFKRSMKLLLKDMAGLKGLPQPKGEMLAWALNAIEDLTREPMYRKALPSTQCHF